MTSEQELKIENSRQLTNVALVLLPAVAVVVRLIIQYRNVSDVFWWLAGAAAISCALSIFLGGLGISRLRRGKSTRFSPFNGQAILVVFSFLLLLFTYLSTGVEKQNDVQKQLVDISKNIGLLQGRLTTLKENISSINDTLKQQDSKASHSESGFKKNLKHLTQDISKIAKQVDTLQIAVGKLHHNK